MGIIIQFIKFLLKNITNMIYNSIPEESRPASGLLKWFKKPFSSVEIESSSPLDALKRKIASIIKNAIVSVFKKLGSFIFMFADIIFAVMIFLTGAFMLYAIFSSFGPYEGSVPVDIQKLQENYQDESIYIAAQNTEDLRRTFYEYISDTSYYQMFNLKDMNPKSMNPLSDFVSNVVSKTLGKNVSVEDKNAANKDIHNIDALQSLNVLGLLNFDKRYLYTDANKNALKHMKSAEIVSISSIEKVNTEAESINGFFRDYYNRENIFKVSETLLSEMNRILFGELQTGETITYPEAFVKPVAFVNDFFRIQTDPNSENVGEPYVYITKRVTKEDIEKKDGTFYNKPWLEGLIYSKPSKIVYDYAVTSTNTYLWSDASNDTAKQINYGNVSKYGELPYTIEYEDGTSDETSQIIKLYWKVYDSEEDESKKFNKTTYGYAEVNGMNPYNEHMTAGINDNTYQTYFDGPYTRINVDSNGNVSIDETSKIEENSFVYVDLEGNHVDSDSGVKIKHEFNKYPERHLQLAPVFDEAGDIQLSSRYLFNKKLVRKKSVREAYRHYPEYYAGLEEFYAIDEARLPGALWSGENQCSYNDFKKDSELPFNERKCSIIKQFSGREGFAWINAKIQNFLAKIDGDHEAEINASAKAMFMLIMAYEEYLTETQPQGVAWDYKYYSSDEYDYKMAVTQFTDYDGIFEVLGDPRVYEDTIKEVANLDNTRTEKSEYVPTAIISGDTSKSTDTTDESNNIGYGWRIKDLNSIDSGYDSIVLERVAGEASLEFPTYDDGNSWFTYGSIVYSENDFRYEWNGNTLVDKGFDNVDLGTVGIDELAELVENDTRNTEYVWSPSLSVYRPKIQGKDIKKNLESKISETKEEGKITYQTSPYDTLPLEVKSVRDYGLGSVLSYLQGLRVVYDSGVFMDEQYDKVGFQTAFEEALAQEGIDASIFKNADKGYYPKEILEKYSEILESMKKKPLKNEELSSLSSSLLSLQYAATDEENEKANNKKELHELISERNANGFTIGDIDETNQGFKIVYKNSSDGVNVCRDCSNECSLEEGTLREQCLNTCKNEGGYFDSSLDTCNVSCLNQKNNEWNSRNGDSLPEEEQEKLKQELEEKYEYCTNTCTTKFPAPVCQNIDAGKLKNGTVRAYSPYIKPSFLKEFFSWITSFGNGIKNQVQFMDPMQYYIEWFNHLDSENYTDKSLNIIKDGLVSQIDTKDTATIRQAREKEISNISGANETGFGSAGTYLTGDYKKEFYDKNLTYVQPYNLISESESYFVYMIEEAVTFLGTFIYTYKDNITTLNNFSDKKQITSLAYSDRYNYLSNYIYSVPYVKYEKESVYKGSKGWSRTVPSHLTKEEKNRIVDQYYSGKTIYNKITSENVKVDVFDSDVEYKTLEREIPIYCPVESEDTKPDNQTPGNQTPGTGNQTPGNGSVILTPANQTVYCGSYTEYRLDYEVVAIVSKEVGVEVNGDIAYRIDSELKLDSMFTMFSGLKDNTLITTKIYDNNVYDSSFMHNYHTNYIDSTLSYFNGDKDNHYKSLSTVKNKMNSKSGYAVIKDERQLYDSKGLPEDLKMTIDFDGGIKKVRIPTTFDLQNVIKYTQKSTNLSSTGNSFVIPARHEDYVGVGVMMVNRENYGSPIPLFRYYSGSQREILPRQISSYFNGENLDSWTSRLIITDESSHKKEQHIDNEKLEIQNYLYSYIMNFETYVPFNVKTDMDLISRAKTLYNSTSVVNDSTFTVASNYLEEINAVINTEAWKETMEKISTNENKVNINTITQLIAGLIEVEINRATDLTIDYFNESISDNNLKVAYSVENKTIINEILKMSATDKIKNTSGRKIKLTLENGTEKEFDMVYFGSGSIFHDISKGSIRLTTNDIAPNIECGTNKVYKKCFEEATIDISENEDERLNKVISMNYVATKLGKLVRKYGSFKNAIMAYIYGEDYFDALLISSKTNWETDNKEFILEALTVSGKVSQNAKDIDYESYSSKVVGNVLSYIKDTTSKEIVGSVYVDPSSVGVNIGTMLDLPNKVYQKYKTLIDSYSSTYKVDAALIAAMISQESSGNSFSGLCSGDNFSISSDMSNRKCTNLATHNYNGGGGPMQIEAICETDSNGECVRKITSDINKTHIVLKIVDPRTSVKNLSDIESYLKKDDRYGKLEDSMAFGVIFISNLLQKYNNDAFKALVAYNAGMSEVQRLVDSCTDEGWFTCYARERTGTSNYVNMVMRYYDKNLQTMNLNYSGVSATAPGIVKSKFGLPVGELTYNRDLYLYQNSGIELFTSKKLTRDDATLILNNISNFGKEVYSWQPHSYDLISLFTQRESYDTNIYGNGPSWVGLDANIVELGKKTTSSVPENFKFTWAPPQIPMRIPFDVGTDWEKTITSHFGARSLDGMHYGLDFGLREGTPIYAVATGYVSRSRWVETGGGYIVTINHVLPENRIITTTTGKKYRIDAISTSYMHNSSLIVKEGYVIATDCTGITKCHNFNNPIAMSGKSGNSTGPHLHFEVSITATDMETGKSLTSERFDRMVDPYYWLTTKWE